MTKKYSENLIRMKCKDCGSINYFMHKNKKANPNKLSLKKYCRVCLKHTAHQETKK